MKKLYKHIILLLYLLIFPLTVLAMELDDDQEDFEDAIEAAQQAGNNENFSAARQSLREAKMLGVGSSEVKDIEKCI